MPNKALQKILVIFAHPAQYHSKANLVMAKAAKQIDNVTFLDLYATYPQLKIDVDAEQQRLTEHDIIIFQFPVFWYSTPSLLKEWQDLVLEHGFAYGHTGDKLKGKKFLCAATAGGDEHAYSQDGHNDHDLRSFLLPLEQTAKLCQMHYIPPFILHGALAAQTNGDIEKHAEQYGQLLTALVNNKFDYKAASKRNFLNISPLPIS